MADFHVREIKRSLIPAEEFSQKEFYDFYKEKDDIMREYTLQKQAEKELEEKLTEYVSAVLEDLFIGFDDKGQSGTKQMDLKIDL